MASYKPWRCSHQEPASLDLAGDVFPLEPEAWVPPNLCFSASTAETKTEKRMRLDIMGPRPKNRSNILGLCVIHADLSRSWNPIPRLCPRDWLTGVGSLKMLNSHWLCSYSIWIMLALCLFAVQQSWSQPWVTSLRGPPHSTTESSLPMFLFSCYLLNNGDNRLNHLGWH